jgi:hypothetical protein
MSSIADQREQESFIESVKRAWKDHKVLCIVGLVAVVVAVVVAIVLGIVRSGKKDTEHKEEFKFDLKETDNIFQFATEWLNSVTGIKYA